MPDTTPAESVLGPITPIRCPELGCHWACHGVPDKYADSRARIVREHLAAEHAPTPEPSPAAVWVDGDPLMEAMAAAVYEQCRTEPSIVVDDPRNIAAVAATVARRLLGTTVAEGGEPTDRDVVEAHELALGFALAAPPVPADRAVVLREAADIAESLREFTPAYGARKSAQISENVGVLRVADHFRALADDAAAGVQPPTSEADEKQPVIAYRDPRNSRVLLCREHGERWHGVVPVTSEDLPDGGICTFGRLSSYACGREVLATPPAAPAAPEETAR